MKKPLSKAEMRSPTNAQRGEPNYVDESADSPGIPYLTKNSDMDVPKYRASNPRYWEYR